MILSYIAVFLWLFAFPGIAYAWRHRL